MFAAAKNKIDSVVPESVMQSVSRFNEAFADPDKEDLDGAQPPWVCNSESGKLYAKEIQERALQLTEGEYADVKDVFLTPPPADKKFQFDFSLVSTKAQAMAAIRVDPNLDKIRFLMVPTTVPEDEFWRSYFWKCHQIKSSFTSMGAFAEQPPKTTAGTAAQVQPAVTSGAPMATVDDSDMFVSDDFLSDSLDDEQIRANLAKELGICSTGESAEMDAWEAEMKAELEGALEFESDKVTKESGSDTDKATKESGSATSSVTGATDSSDPDQVLVKKPQSRE
jgi:hypothetical protein